jgi:hypothetical protein
LPENGCVEKSFPKNVGSVKHALRTRTHALLEQRHFALIRRFALSNLDSLLIVGLRNSVRSIDLFDHNLDHDYFFELPCQTGAIPNHYVGDLLPTMGISELSRVRTELFRLTVIQFLAPHQVQMHR